jgi:hypothetical protein
MHKTETCYFCDREAEYDQTVTVDESTYTVSGVCKVHLRMGLSV